MGWTADDLLTSIRQRGVIPTAQDAYTDARLLTLAHEELLSYVFPLMKRAQEGYGIVTSDAVSIPTSKRLRIPSRAAGSNIEDVLQMEGSTVSDILRRTSHLDAKQGGKGYYIQDAWLCFTGEMSGFQVKVRFPRRPSKLVLTAACGLVSNVNGAVVTLAAVPSGWTDTASYSFDLQKGTSPFDVLQMDRTGTVATGAKTITFGSSDVTADLSIGDYICKADESLFPQIPMEMHPVLAQRVVVKYAESQGDSELYQTASAALQRAEGDAMALMSSRAPGAKRSVIPTRGLWRR